MGVYERIKETASRKKEAIAQGIEKEREYHAFKNPDIAYIAGGKATTDYRYSGEFSERLAREKERNAERREAIKSKVRSGARTIGGKLKQAVNEDERRYRRAPPPDPMGWGSDNILGGGKPIDPLGFGGKGKKKRFELW